MSLWISSYPRHFAESAPISEERVTECRPTLIPPQSTAAESRSSIHVPAALEPATDVIESIRGYDMVPPSHTQLTREHLKRCLERAKAGERDFPDEPPTLRCRVDWDS